MRCDDCQLVIEEYFDGELGEQSARQVRCHLEGCPSCSRVLQRLTDEQSLYVAGGSEIEMRSDLWFDVRERLALEEQSANPVERFRAWLSSVFVLPRINGWTAVALVILAVGVTMLLTRYLDGSPGDRPLASVSESLPSAAPAPPEKQAMLEREPSATGSRIGVEHRQKTETNNTAESIAADRKGRQPSYRIGTVGKTKTAEQLVREAELKYLAAIAMLSRTVDRKRAHIDVATLAKLEQALASIDRTIADTRKAVRRRPDDPEVVQYMLTAYAKKVDVLREMVDY